MGYGCPKGGALGAPRTAPKSVADLKGLNSYPIRLLVGRLRDFQNSVYHLLVFNRGQTWCIRIIGHNGFGLGALDVPKSVPPSVTNAVKNGEFVALGGGAVPGTPGAPHLEDFRYTMNKLTRGFDR